MDSNLVAHAKLEKMFGTRKYNGFKPKPNEHLIVANCDALLKLYITVYAHPPNNG
jgi:hypothetical protein